ncbi:MAG: RNA polymerase sigma factor [Armatimonadota bacterium]
MIDEFAKNADACLVENTRNGDIAAFEALFNKYHKRIYNLIYRMVGNEQDAGDLTQEVFIRVYNSMQNLRSDLSFYAWLRTVAVNICRDHYRKIGRTIKADSLDEKIVVNGGEIDREVEDWTYNPELLMEKKDVRNAVNRAVDTLSVEHKEVIVLHHIEGMDVADIAKQLGIPVGTVKSRLARARDELKRKLGHYVA